MNGIRRLLLALAGVLFPETEGERLARTADLPLLRERVRRRDRFPEFEGVALLPYADPVVRALVKRLKYKGDRRVADLLGALLHESLYEELAERSVSRGPVTLIPVPLSNERLRSRGFNQAEVVARAMAAQSPDGYEVRANVLERVADTPSQTAFKTSKEREENMRGAFRIREGLKAPVYCVLLDDVVTSGSTMREAARALAAGGAKRIFCIAAAH